MVKENGNSHAVLGRTKFAKGRNYMERESNFLWGLHGSIGKDTSQYRRHETGIVSS